MKTTRLTFGAVAGILVTIAIMLIAALRWVGDHAGPIERGMGLVVSVLAFALVLAGIACGGVWLARNRHLLIRPRAAEQPARLQAHQVLPVPEPVEGRGEVPALPAGSSPVVILHLDQDRIAALIRDADGSGR